MKNLFYRFAFAGVALALLAAVALSAWVQENPRMLYERARLLDEGNQNLTEAITLYGQVADSAKDQPALAARALVQMGRCQERLGQVEARKAYQRVLDEYPQQLEEVKLARERLTVLSKESGVAAGKPTFKQIRIPSTLPFGAQLSPDGSNLAFATTKDLWILPLQGNVSPDVAGVPKKLPVSLPEGVGIDRDGLAWSADGKWIAFNDFVKKKKGPYASNIYVVSSKGGIPKKVSATPERGELSYDYRLGVSPNGKQVVFTSQENGQQHLETIFVQGGPAKRLTELPSTEPAYSPDGRLIAYVSRRMYTTAGETKRFEHPPGGVWVVPADGGTPVLVADVKSQANYPIWSPDGRMIAFRADEAIWVVPVSPDGKPTAKPTRFDPPHPFSSVLAGWTNDNEIGLVLRSSGYAAIYTVPTSGGQASQVTPPNVWSNPKWSPDGKRIFFRNQSGHVSSVAAEGGEVIDVPVHSDVKILEPSVGGENAISPDGKTIVFAGVKDGLPGIHLWTIPVAGGEPKQLTSDERESIENRFPCWSSDGEWIAFVRGQRLKGDIQYYANVNIYRMPANGGEPTPLTTDADKVAFGDIALSPGRKSVAYFSAEDNMTIKVKSLETGASRIVGKAERPGWNSLSWSPDGKKLAFTPASNVQGPFSRIRIISLDDGTTTTLETGLPESDYWHVSWSPDGTKLAFGALQNGETEFWLMENFLPLMHGR
jgi:Tol biopolymer transport system component